MTSSPSSVATFKVYRDCDIYGDSLALMKPLITDLLTTYPLCQNARVVDLTPS